MVRVEGKFTVVTSVYVNVEEYEEQEANEKKAATAECKRFYSCKSTKPIQEGVFMDIRAPQYSVKW